MKTHTLLSLCLGSFFAAGSLWGSSSGAPAQTAGVPGEGDCTACHGSGLNTGAGSLKIELLNASTWSPGTQARLRITLADPTARRWGFQLTARSASASTQMAGTFAPADTNSRLVTSGTNTYVTHTTVGTSNGTSTSASWEVLWTPPASASFGDVTFYAAGNAANASNSADSGDKIYSKTLNVSPGATTPTGIVKALPQLAFGGNWYTAIYLSNTTSAPVSATLNFLGEDGSALTVPGSGSSVTVNLAARGTALVEAPDNGGLLQGWVQATLPDGVIGYGVFRQAIPGSPKQEAVVPLSSVTSTTTTLLYDETAFDTGVAVLNPSSTATTITVTARGADGVTLGTGTITLAAKSKTALLLRGLAGLATMQGTRGSVDFIASGGAVSVLGLRFNGSSFTSILPAER